MAKVLMIIAPERFRDEELFITKEELEKDGHETVIASTIKGICAGSRGGFAIATLTLNEVHTGDYDAVVFVAGGGFKDILCPRRSFAYYQKKCIKGKILFRLFVLPR
jgi:protease I